MRAAGGCALAILLAPALASAAVTLDVEAVFPAVRIGDPAMLAVLVENDQQARTIAIEASGKDVANGPRSLVRLGLAAGARKEIALIVPPDALTSGRVLVRAADAQATLAERVARVELRAEDEPLFLCLGPAPPELLRAAHESAMQPPVEIGPDALPGMELAWPSLDAIVWPTPSAAALRSEGLAALQRWTRAGGRLVAGVNVEEPDALAGMGLVDAEIAGPGAEITALLRDLASRRATARGPSWAGTSIAGHGARLTTAYLSAGSQSAPRLPAAVLLGAFFVAAVPLEAWLVRRATVRRRRGRFALLRAPLIAVVATLAAHALATSAARRMGGSSRLDVIELHADGRGASGLALLGLSRGRSSEALVELPGLPTHALSSFGPWQRPDSMAWSLVTGPAARLRVGGWEPALVQARLAVDGSPRPDVVVGPSSIDVVTGRLAWIEVADEPRRAVPSRSAGPLPEGLIQLTWAWYARGTEAADPVLCVVTDGATPGATVDGEPVTGAAYTLWRIPLTPGQAALPLVIR